MSEDQYLLANTIEIQDWQNYKVPETSVQYKFRNKTDNYSEFLFRKADSKLLISKYLWGINTLYGENYTVPGYQREASDYTDSEEEKEI